jgi:nickel-dependent lactate racemase
MSLIGIDLPYGHGSCPVRLPASRLLGQFLPEPSRRATDQDLLVRTAIEHPIGTPRLRELVHRGQNVAVVISDTTRPCPARFLLPFVLHELQTAGVSEEEILIIIGLGLHRSLTEVEIENLVGGPVCQRVRVINHDPADVVRLGTTSSGTPVELFRHLVNADFRVCLGNVEFHYFAGFSGGAKAIMPGCASKAAVTANHAMMIRAEATSGRIDGNPVRMDIEEAASMVGAGYILNVVVDSKHRIIRAVAGDVVAAHRDACGFVARRGSVDVSRQADIVLASAGGYPKDINLYQAQKGLENAGHVVRDGGVVILVAECREGFGNATFEEWITTADRPSDLIDRIQREFVLGGHKAAAVAAIQQRATVYLVSALPPDLVRRANIVPFVDPQNALQAAFSQVGQSAQVAVLPQASSVVPRLMD